MKDQQDLAQEQQQNQADAEQAQTQESEQTQAHDAADVEANESDAADNARIGELELALAQAQAQIKDQQDSVLRAKAEVDNARRRATQDVEKAHKFALEKFAAELLPVIDNLERAIDAADTENEAIKPLVEGVELTHKTFLSSVAKFGLEIIDPLNAPFDPAKHQAMGMQESTEVPANHVMMVMQKGYELNGRVIRPAMVMVAKAPAGETDAASVDTQV